MFTEKSLRQHCELVKAFMGIPSEVFFEMVKQIELRLPEYEATRLQKEGRKREIGAGREFEHSLVIRVALVLTYLRLHIPQETVAVLYGCQQWDVSRELRRLLPLIQEVLPCPEVWKRVKEEDLDKQMIQLELEQMISKQVLVDATEQRVSRPSDSEKQRDYYSGKKKQHTLKTELVSDTEHRILAISEAVSGKMHDKRLSDEVKTLERLPDGCEVKADSGYQGLDKQVKNETTSDVTEQKEAESKKRLSVSTSIKKPKGGQLTDEQKEFNRELSKVRVRIEHCIGWVKNWAIIATRFRCDHAIYTPILKTVCGLVNAQTFRWQAAKNAYCA